MTGKHLHLLIGPIIIAPSKKMVKGILGKNQGRRKERQQLQAGNGTVGNGGRAGTEGKAKEIRIENDQMFRRNLLWVPDGLIQQIMESEHETKVARHMGQDKTIELI